MISERFEFPGALGHALAARLDLPPGKPRGYALFAHCFTCGKNNLAAGRIAAGLASHGIAVLRFDFTGLGSSEGEFANTDFSSNVGDLLAAVEHLRQTRAAPALLIGHSLGGTAVLAAAGRVPEAKAVATINAPFEPSHLRHALAGHLPEIEARGEAEIRLGDETFRIRREFLDDLKEHDQTEHVRTLRKALLVLHSPLDSMVGIDEATKIFVAAKHPKSFVSLDRADHLLSDPADARYAAEILAAWASRSIGDGSDAAGPDATGPAEDIEPVPGAVVVRETRRGKFQQIVATGPHRLLADEPAEIGGTDTGPGPYDLLLAGLGACTTMTVRLYADHKAWPLERVEVVLRHGRRHAEDCEHCEDPRAKIDHIDRDITFKGPLDADQRARLLAIAEKCPVHRTLHSEIRIQTREVGGEER